MKSRKSARRSHHNAAAFDDGEAFLHDTRCGFEPIIDADVEALGEELVAAATSNDAVAELARGEGRIDDHHAFAFSLFDGETFEGDVLF